MSFLDLTIVPANEAVWADIEAIIGTRGEAARCWCQRYKLEPGESFAAFPAQERAARMREQTCAGRPAADRTSGLVAYADDEPVGWCAVEPRPAFVGLVRSARVPWVGRDEDPHDDAVWAVTCVFVRAGRRRRGIGRALARAAVAHALACGARAVEAYPMTTTAVLASELHVGTVGMFSDAGLVEVGRPTARRAVMRRAL